MIQLTFKRLAIATLLGAFTMFTWGGLSHLIIFTGTGFTQLPNEDKVVEVLKTNISEKGLYFFPGKDFRNSTKEQNAVFESKYKNGPVGMLIYRPLGGDVFSANKLIAEFISNLVSAFIAVLIASSLYARYWKRVLMIALLGVLACSSVSIIYWNWYEFPTSFFMAQILDMAISFLLTGLVICSIIKNPIR
jgi:hypothetical protein